MNKQELIGSVAETTGLSRSDASRAVEGVFDAIGAALKRGDEVRLVGFGTFSCSRRKASTGRNPRTGAPMEIKASSQPKFKAGKSLKDSVRRADRGLPRSLTIHPPVCWNGSGGRLSGRAGEGAAPRLPRRSSGQPRAGAGEG